jgi:hypothetical protein
MCRDDTVGWASTSLDEADSATDQLQVVVNSARRVRRTVRMIENLLGKALPQPLRPHFGAEHGRMSRLAHEVAPKQGSTHAPGAP